MGVGVGWGYWWRWRWGVSWRRRDMTESGHHDRAAARDGARVQVRSRVAICTRECGVMHS